MYPSFDLFQAVGLSLEPYTEFIVSGCRLLEEPDNMALILVYAKELGNGATV